MTDNQNRIESTDLTALTASIVASYVGNHNVSAENLPSLISQIRSSLDGSAVAAPAAPVAEKQRPAVPIKKSITDEGIICLEDGKTFKSLKRHLMTAFNMTPEEYREKWELPSDYPMVAPAYARQRSELARTMGLGLDKTKHHRKAAAATAKAPKAPRAKKVAAEPASTPAEAPATTAETVAEAV